MVVPVHLVLVLGIVAVAVAVAVLVAEIIVLVCQSFLMSLNRPKLINKLMLLILTN